MATHAQKAQRKRGATDLVSDIVSNKGSDRPAPWVWQLYIWMKSCWLLVFVYYLDSCGPWKPVISKFDKVGMLCIEILPWGLNEIAFMTI